MLPSHAGLARIVGHAAAISAEADRLLSLGVTGEEAEGKLAEVLAEMRAMSQLLAETRAEVIGLAPAPVGVVRLQEAGDTLDAVVAETERAAFEILQQAERAQAAARRLHHGQSADASADLAEVDEAATTIVLACVFQDITGQRIRKVLNALRQIEARIGTLVEIMGIGEHEAGLHAAATASGAAPDSHLLNGPSSAAEGGLGQGAVDDIFG